MKHVGDDYLMNLRCPHGYYMAKIVTRYSFRASDRCWDVTCKRSLVEMSEDCTRASKKYLYDAGEPFTFECPDKHALVGKKKNERPE